MKILFPSREDHPYKVNESFELEYNAANSVGLQAYIFDENRFLKSGVLSHSAPLAQPGDFLILRSWMLKINDYENLCESMLNQFGYNLINDKFQYTSCHHSHSVHHLFGNNTPREVAIPNLTVPLFEKIITDNVLENYLDKMRNEFKSDCFILKDSVKSEKHIPELFIIPLSITGKEFKELLVKFIAERGSLYNNGLVFKEFVALKKNKAGIVNEWRNFVFNGEIISSHQNTGLNSSEVNKPDITWIKSMIQNIPSNFFTIDVAEKENGSWTIIETGDGQVSGLSPGQNELEFYDNLKNELSFTKYHHE